MIMPPDATAGRQAAPVMYRIPRAAAMCGMGLTKFYGHVRRGDIVATRLGRFQAVSEAELFRVARDGLPEIPNPRTRGGHSP